MLTSFYITIFIIIVNNPNEYPSGTLSADKSSIVAFNGETGQHEWLPLDPIVTTKKKATKDVEVATKS